MASALAQSCALCKKSESDSRITLKTCSKCKNTHYCSKDCQKNDWLKHKVFCTKPKSEKVKVKEFTGFDIKKWSIKNSDVESLFQVEHGTWLHNHSEEMVFKILIDCFRMRMEDEGEVDEKKLYVNDSTGRQEFIKFLNLAEKRQGLLPPWWSPAKRAACIAYGMRPDVWSSFKTPIDQDSVRNHYDDPLFPWHLKELGEKVYGHSPEGTFYIEGSSWDENKF